MQEVSKRIAYPETRVDSDYDTLANISLPDPYRWLEKNDEEVRRWQSAQAALARKHTEDWPHFKKLREQVAKFSTDRYVALPRYAGGRWFRIHSSKEASQAQAVVADTPTGEGRVLYDPVSENSIQPPYVSWISPSPDGRTLAIGVCSDGSESNTVRLIEVSTGQPLADPPSQKLMDNWTGGVHWLPDSSGFFFVAIRGAATEFVQEVYLHRRSPTSVTVPVDVPWTTTKDWRMVVVSRDGRYIIALERLRNPIPIAIAPISQGPWRWRPFVTSISGTVAGHLVGDRYIAITDVKAPRGRLIGIPVDAEDPNDADAWEELLPESSSVLRTVTPIGSVLYVTELVDTYARIRIVSLDGKEHTEVPLPVRGAVGELPFPIMNLIPRGQADSFLFSFSSLTTSPGTHSHTVGQAGITTLSHPVVQIDNTVVEDRWATSRDGTRIPYHVVRQAGMNVTQPGPTLIWAYGGFNLPFVPQFPGPMAAFVAAGGVFVHAHLRGGAELGFDWWQGGRMLNKQNCYDDLFAIAEDMIAAGICTPSSLAVTGASNGGLMAGVAATQRPDLWKVVVPRVPILDLVGACREPYGRLVVGMEYGDVDHSDEVRRLTTFSPYHLVREGVPYPAIFIDAGDTDPRCPPWHARKFAARLQHASSGANPILLHVWENVGHGWATNKNISIEENTEWLAFTMRHLGLTLTTTEG